MGDSANILSYYGRLFIMRQTVVKASLNIQLTSGYYQAFELKGSSLWPLKFDKV